MTSRSQLSGEFLAELLPIVRELSTVLDPDELLPRIAASLRRIADFKIVDIFLAAPDGGLRPAYASGYDPAVAKTLHIAAGQGIVGSAAQTREPIFVPDVTRDPRYVAIVPGVVAELAIPLIHRDRVVGVLNLEGPDVSAFSGEAQTALRVLASHVAVALDNATLYKELRWYAGLLATLYEIGKETASILDLDLLLARVAEIVKRVIDYEMFGILLLDEDAGELVLRKAVRYALAPQRSRMRLGEGLCGHAALTKQAILVGDVSKDPRYLNWVPHTRSELVVPLVHKDRVVGVFDLESSELHRFNEEHVKVLTPLAAQVAIAIENARLYEELQRRDARLHKELVLAQEVQHGLFPEECPQGPGWEASAHFLPARELGGDLYDFYDIGPTLLGLAVGDVAGKGVPAALLAAFASGTVRARAFERRPPAELLKRVNRTLRRRGAEVLYCTLTYALFDFEQHAVKLANSGLPFPLHYRAHTGRCLPVPLPGLPLGSFEDVSYDETTLPLAAGDIFVFHSDGVSEAAGVEGEYGVGRLAAQVEAGASLPARALGERIVADFEGFCGKGDPADDVTLVVVKIV